MNIKFWHRIQLPDGTYTPGICNHGPDGGVWPTTRFGLPENLKGKTILDVGCYDGFFSFEAEKRGCTSVLASDLEMSEGFKYCHEKLNSKVIHVTMNIEGCQVGDVNFDYVFCFGVLYHIKSPLKALENLSSFTKSGGVCLIETAMSDLSGALLEYRPNEEGDETNFFYPTIEFIHKASKEVGFSQSRLIHKYVNRATFRLEKT